MSKKDIKIYHTFLASENVADIIKICPEMIQALPEEESRQFYINKFEFFKDHPEFKQASEILDKNNVDFYSIFLALFLRYFFVRCFEDTTEIVDEKNEYFIKSNVPRSYSRCRGSANVGLCQVRVRDFLPRREPGDVKAWDLKRKLSSKGFVNFPKSGISMMRSSSLVAPCRRDDIVAVICN